jgi:hypothetical protein
MASILKVDQIQESTTGVGTNFSTTGSATTPTISIGNQTNKGFYDLGADTLGIAIGGSKVGEIGSGYGGFTGNVIQVKSVVLTSAATFNSVNTNNFVDIVGLSVSIIPKYSTSKILIMSYINAAVANGTLQGRLYRDSISIFQGDTVGGRLGSSFGIRNNASPYDIELDSVNLTFLDSPNTTSNVTYKIALTAGATYSTLVSINRTISDTNSDYGIRTPSSIVLMEIQQ